MINIGIQAPIEIAVLDTNYAPVSLRDVLGSYVVLYAYSSDEAPECKQEACGIRDVHEKLKAIGVTVIGVSPDDVPTHKNFIDLHTLNFSLWSDVNCELLSALGVCAEEISTEESVANIQRATFLINTEGTVVQVWDEVEPERHGEEILNFITKEIRFKASN